MEEIAEVYARALFEVAQERDVLDLVHEQVGQFADAMHERRELAVFFFSPYFSTEEKLRGLGRMVKDADPAFENFLQALIERHRMPVIYRIRTRFEELWVEERKLLPVEVTSAVPLEDSVINSLGKRIGDEVDRQIEISSNVDPEILGGVVLRVGNLILDASIRNRLEQLRKQVAQA
jgi:F-type H+-transporting ATPase subunit delta